MKNSKKFIIKLILLALLTLLPLSIVHGFAYFQWANDREALHMKKPPSIESAATEQRKDFPFGVWWWSNQDVEMQQLMEFAAAQGVNEIYWSAGFGRTDWCEKAVVEFMFAAYEKGITVYYLTGDWSWIYNDSGLIHRLEAFFTWQESACEATRFAGVHINIEPHQDPAWKNADADTRNKILQRYIDLKVRVTDCFGPMDWSIPFWWWAQEPFLVNHRGETRYLYRASILEADRVFVLSYRNTAQGIYDVGRHCIDFAREVDRPIFLSALAHYGRENPEHDHVYFYLRGYEYMMHVLTQLREIVDYEASGIAVHEINGWYRMWKNET